MANYLFMATIPSIGKLISSSRKTEDIWAGSMLVAYLMKSILKEIIAKYNSKLELIFPFQMQSIYSDFADISNKILLLLTDFTQEEIKNLANNMKKILNKNLKELIDFVLSECDIRDTEYKNLAWYQIENTIEFFWGATEISDEYKKSRQELEDYIGYLKDSHLRKDRMYQGYVLINSDLEIQKESFDEFQKKDNYESYCRGAYTCTICGDNTIIGATKEEYKGNVLWNKMWESNKFKRGERLCGFCMVKRFLSNYLNKQPFPSTSEIASTYFKKQLIEKQDILKKLFDIFKRVIKTLPEGNPVSALRDDLSKITNHEIKSFLKLDGEWFMVDTWKNSNNYANYGISNEMASSITNELEKIYREHKLFPSEMYAILKLDGDNMGAKISELNKEGHKKLSSLQMAFTQKVKEIIKVHYGEPVYIGGDDILGLFPVEGVIECAKKIRDTIPEKMKEIRDLLPKGKIYDFTLTGSLLIVHHLLPLRFVLDELYELEKEAKNVNSKDSLGIKLIKHSMSSEKIILKWNKIDMFKKTMEIPKSFIYQLSNISHILQNENFRIREAIIRGLLKGKIEKAQIDNLVDILLKIDEDLVLSKICSFLRLTHTIYRKVP